jgi:hypothetical protein
MSLRRVGKGTILNIHFFKGFWTVFVNDVPTLACVSFDRALYWLETMSLELQ